MFEMIRNSLARLARGKLSTRSLLRWAAAAAVFCGAAGALAKSPAHYLAVYDGASGVGWTNGWAGGLWAPNGYDPDLYPNQAVNYSAPAPGGRAGVACELKIGSPPLPWAFTPYNAGKVADYLNEIKTFEFDLYLETDSEPAESMEVAFNDGGAAEVSPALSDLIPNWAAMTTEQRYGHWHHVVINLADLGPKSQLMGRMVFYHNGNAVHMAMTDMALGWDDDRTPPAVTNISASFDAASSRLSVTFDTDEMTIYRVEYGSNFSKYVQGNYNDWQTEHTVALDGLTPGETNVYRILLLDHHIDPATDGNVGISTNSFYVRANATPPENRATPQPQWYLSIYNSQAGVWTNGWSAGFWAPGDWVASTDPLHSYIDSAEMPGRPGELGLDITLGEPPDRPWALTLDAPWGSCYYFNEVRTLDFDVYFPTNAQDLESLWFVINDAQRSTEPAISDLISNWFTMTQAQRCGQWHHVSIDFQALNPIDFSIGRLVFYHYGDSYAHFYMSNLKYGIVNRTTPPVITVTNSVLSYDYRSLSLGFTADEPILYRVEYGVSDLTNFIASGANDWSESQNLALTNLAPGTTCQYRIVAWDRRLDPSAASNVAIYASSIVVPPAPTAPPAILGLGATNVTGSRATLFWTNERPATASITYHKSGGENLARTFNGFVTNCAYLLDLLEPNSSYAATVVITDAFGLTSTRTIVFTTGAATAPSVTITVDRARNHRISPWIYGLNALDLAPNCPFYRSGGNRLTCYNWENNASNAGSDWLYENDNLMSESFVPAESIRSFVDSARALNAASLVTVQLQGYVAADEDGPVKLADPDHIAKRFKQVVYQKNAPFASPPDTNDAYVYIDEFLWTLRNKFSGDIYSDVATPTFISLDNEPDLWFSTHQEVQPSAMPSSEFLQRSIALCSSLKTFDPSVRIFGPVNYGFAGMQTFQGASRYNNGYWFVDNYLEAMRDASSNAGTRLLDVYDFHWYSEAYAGDTRVESLTGSALTDEQIQTIVQSPRSLWDTNYSENSWIVGAVGGPIAILKRMQAKIDADYPGTGLAITEYDNGGDNHIAGAIAQADNLGVFGSEGLFAASWWQMNSSSPFILGGFRMYRDYDGTNGSFGDISLPATSSATTNVAVYASQDSARPGRYVLVAINRSFDSQDVGFTGLLISGEARVFRIEGTNSIPAFVGQVNVNLASWVISLPALSVSTIEITGATANTYAAWQAANFTGSDLADTNISGPLSDPDKVGVPNFVRYAFNLPARGAVPATVSPKLTSTNGQTQLEIHFTRRAAAGDIAYLVETSADLKNWSSLATLYADPDTQAVVAIPISAESPSRSFARVKVTYQPQ